MTIPITGDVLTDALLTKRIAESTAKNRQTKFGEE